jgi:hypothetical protein
MTRCAVSAICVVPVAQICRSWICLDTRQGCKGASHSNRIDTVRDTVKQQMQGLFEQAPGAEENHRGYGQTHDRVKPGPLHPERQCASHHDPGRHKGVCGHVQERTVITRHLLGQAGLKPDEADSGAVTLIQRFGFAKISNTTLACPSV